MDFWRRLWAKIYGPNLKFFYILIILSLPIAIFWCAFVLSL